MSIRVLAVEDDPSFALTLTSLVTDQGSDVSFQLARSRDSAISQLTEESFDLVVLDLKLPTADNSLDPDVEHGRYILHQARELAPGTPILVLTGSPAEGFITNFLDHSEQVDVWGSHNTISTIGFLRKSELDQLPEKLAPMFHAIRGVRDVEIRRSGDRTNLSWEEDRLIRIFTRRRNGASCEVRQISGGLSEARVFRVLVKDAGGAPDVSAILKIGPPNMVRAECESYEQYCVRLSENATPRLFEHIKFGGGRLAAVAYRLASEYDANLFDVASADPARCKVAIEDAAAMLEPWRKGIGELQGTIGDVRRRLLSDDRAAQVAERFDIGWTSDFESRNVQLRWCPIHGDFHGANVLVSAEGKPIFIDYGDIGLGPSSLDWITLELSSIFHVDGIARHSDWPTLQVCDAWATVDGFAGGSPIEQFVRSCRLAASKAGAGDKELAACVYAYTFRQLAYDDTDKEKALRIMHAARRFIDEET